MRVFDKVDVLLDKLERLDDWVVDQLPTSWVKPGRQDPQETPDANGWDVVNISAIVIKGLILLVVASIWLLTSAPWWAAILGTVGCLLGGAILSVYVREELRRR